MNRLLPAADAVQSAFKWIAEASVMSILVILLILALRAALRNRLPARWTYLLWTIVALRLLVPWTPDSTFSLYQWLAVPDWFHTQTTAASIELTPHDNHPISSQLSANSTDSASSNAISQLSTQTTDTIPSNAITTNTAADKPINERLWTNNEVRLSEDDSTHQHASAAKQTFSLTALLAVIWFIGAASAAFIMIRNNWRLSRSIRLHAVEIIDENIMRQLVGCEKMLKLHRRVKVYAVKRNVASPALSGIWSPKLLLPADTLHILTDEQLRHIMLHELSHLKRWDLPMNALMHILLAVHWFNPLLWYAYTAMREDQELACDELALSKLRQEDSREYALTIIKLLETWSAPIRLANTAGLSSNKQQLKRRITMITIRRRAGIRRSLLGIAVIVIAAGCSLTAAPEEDKPQAASSATANIADDTIVVVSDDFSKEMYVSGLPEDGSRAERANFNLSSDEPIVNERYGRLVATLEDYRLYAQVTEEPRQEKEWKSWPIYHLDEFTIEKDGKARTFPWSLSVDQYYENYSPIIKMELNDVDADGEEELIVKLTTKLMTNPDRNHLYMDQLHIVQPKDLSETSLPDPVDAVNAAVDSSIAPNGDKMIITATSGSEQLVVKIDKKLALLDGEAMLDDAAYWNDHLIFGRKVYYFMTDDGGIRAGISGAASSGGGLSFSTIDAIVTYNTDFSIQSVKLIQ